MYYIASDRHPSARLVNLNRLLPLPSLNDVDIKGYKAYIHILDPENESFLGLRECNRKKKKTTIDQQALRR